jgi:hypothetical protein
MVKVSRAVASLNWSSVFSDVVEIKNVKLSGIAGTLSLEDPLRIVYCLQDLNCRSPRVRSQTRAQLASSGDLHSTSGQHEEVRKPLRLHVDTLLIDGGELLLKRSENVMRISIVRGHGKDFSLPLDYRSGTLELDLFVDPIGHSEAAEAYPVRLKAGWRMEAGGDDDGVLRLELFTKNLPLSVVSTLFPEAFPGTGSFGGTLSGALALEFSAARGWKLLD